MSKDSLVHLDLPNPLMMMLGTLQSQYDIKNWSIYSNNNQNTCVVIRFDDTHGCTQPMQYKRISEKQMARSKARSDTYKQNNSQNIQSADTNQSKKRKCDKMQVSSPEILRKKSDSSSSLYICDIDSPEIPDMPMTCDADYIKVDHNTNTASSSQMQTVSSDSFTPKSLVLDTEPSVVNVLSPSTDKLLDKTKPEYHLNSDVTIESQKPYRPQPAFDQYHAIGISTTAVTSAPKGYVSVSSVNSPNISTDSTHFTRSFEEIPSVPPSHLEIEHIPVDESIISCPCCYEDMSATHECAIAKSRDDSTDSLVYTPNDNEICTSIPDQTIPLSTSPPHSANHPNPEPPDGSTPTLNVDNIIWGLSALLDSKIK